VRRRQQQQQPGWPWAISFLCLSQRQLMAWALVTLARLCGSSNNSSSSGGSGGGQAVLVVLSSGIAQMLAGKR
jgi:hypothetical protein